MDETLSGLAAEFGIATEFWDWQGEHRTVSDATVTAVLGALGVDASSPESAAASLSARADAERRRMLPVCLVVREHTTVSFPVHVTHGDPASVWVELEGGGYRNDLQQLDNFSPPVHLDGRDIGEATFAIPPGLPMGYHRLKAWSNGAEATCALIVTPEKLAPPPRLGQGRAWGVATQIYSVRSEQSWGLGDLTDLTDLAGWAGAEHGAGFVLINPLHAAEPVAPMEPSPYLPTSRRFVNPVYLRPERIPEFAGLPTAARAVVDDLLATLRRDLAGLDRLDRDLVWAAKSRALALVHGVPRTAGREIAYTAYRTREGQGLVDFATWCALAEVHGNDWRVWPADLRTPGSPAVQQFREAHPTEVDFHSWLQWVVDEQLAAAQSAALRSGMSLGVMTDLAVGVNPAGADTWRLHDVFAAGVTVGAPPDAYNQNGQDWTQPPWRPDRLAELQFAPFRDMVRAALRSAGGLRVDHIIGLFRLWWIPEGAGPTEGTYVRYDHEALIGILALEAARAGALVVGEDLGTVEPWVREFLTARGILGTSILWFEFEFDAGGGPLRPEWWRESCLASVTTHDLPPTAGYLAGDHVRLRQELGLLTRTLAEELAADAAEQRAWLDELRSRGALTGNDPDTEQTVLALHRYLTWTPSKLLAVALTDLVGDRRTQNQPGTVDEYPNWRVPLTGPDGSPLGLEDVFTSGRAAALAAVVR
ncbi:4-alpha-glucanotransferase [Nakamurella sp. YIM 132087]|uniref:4-alpha-glucanotransferase n=1 Tax=Nakamurella alba TaxID=2665158 RepID=A0A7K1FL42_9ACTN|nr:4-alpha-glucanotransferase [Nakamurella alba]MTD14861.1 4-alpha-glucanotransferase [Nakamurella alba]